jgi:hypothetical protein
MTQKAPSLTNGNLRSTLAIMDFASGTGLFDRPVATTVFAWIAAICASHALAQPIVFTELHYHPHTRADAEFIEIQNIGSTPYSMNGCRLGDGVDYAFRNVTIQPGGLMVIARHRPTFTEIYGAISQLAAGTYDGALSNSGERISLLDAQGEVLDTLHYLAETPWPARAAGLGSSIERIDFSAAADNPFNWRASTEFGGSPGRIGIGPISDVVINEIIPHTDPPLEDAIELYNTTDAPINIGGWYLSDSRSTPTRYRIPDDTVIAAGGYQVFYEYQFNQEPPLPGNRSFALNSVYGEVVTLVQPDAAGQPMLWMDDIEFGGSFNGLSFGRYPNGTGPLVPLQSPTFGSEVYAWDPPGFIWLFRQGTGAENSVPRLGPIIISRLHPDPAPGEIPFIELQNVLPLAIFLFHSGYPENTWRIRGDVEFDFPPGITVDTDERIYVSATDPNTFRAAHKIPSEVQVFGPWSGNLTAPAGMFRLEQPDRPQPITEPDAGYVPYVIGENLEYRTVAPWPVASSSGYAIVRISTEGLASEPARWTREPLSGAPPTSMPEISVQLIRGALHRLTWTQPAGLALELLEASAPNSNAWSVLSTFQATAMDMPRTVDLPSVDNATFYILRRIE